MLERSSLTATVFVMSDNPMVFSNCEFQESDPITMKEKRHICYLDALTWDKWPKVTFC